MKIFVVDDSKPFRDRLIGLLNGHPNIEIVGQAGNSALALKQIPITKADTVIMDIRMPGDSGVDLLKKLKFNHPSIVVVMLTNYPLDQYRKRCMALGADLFIEKTTKADQILEALSGVHYQSKGQKDSS